MEHYEITRSKDEFGNNVTFTWLHISQADMRVLAAITGQEKFRSLVNYPYGLTFMSKTGIEAGPVDYYIMISSEQPIPEELVGEVGSYIKDQCTKSFS